MAARISCLKAGAFSLSPWWRSMVDGAADVASEAGVEEFFGVGKGGAFGEG